MTGDSESTRPARNGPLPLSWRIAILAAVVLQFLLLHGAVWKHLFDWDRSILWSYASIPLLVGLALAARRSLGLRWWFLNTLEIACFKFGITATILLVILVATGELPPPAGQAPAVTATEHRTPKPSPALLPVDVGKTGAVAGRVTTSSGAPVPDAIVFVSTGVEGFRFPLPQGALAIENDGRGFFPPVVLARTGQRIFASSKNGILHTFQLTAGDGSIALNIPLLASGTRIDLPTSELEGIFLVRCAVHRPKEDSARLAIFRHPFVTLSGQDGSFALPGVPAGAVHLQAAGRAQRSQPREALIRAGARTEAILILDNRQ